MSQLIEYPKPVRPNTSLRPGAWRTDHRQWPLPACPWAAVLSLQDVVFLHWPVSPDGLRGAVPEGLEIETFDGYAWLGVVAFGVQRVRARLVRALPGVRAYAQISVRTYVTDADRSGTYFFDMDADNPMVVRAAQAVMGLNIHNARMRVDYPGDGCVRYRGIRTDPDAPSARYRLACRPMGDEGRAEPGTLDHFLHERYCVYAVGADGVPRRGDFHHEPWRLRHARARITHPGPAVSPALGDLGPPAVARFAHGLDLAVWLPKRV